MVPSEASVMIYTLRDAYTLWDVLNDSPVWQDRIFHALAALYGAVAVVALVQLIRVQQRVPDYGWTTQKVFHFLNFLVNGARCLIFTFRRDIQQLTPEARAVTADSLRPVFFAVNGIVYAIQIALWLIIWWKPIHILIVLSKVFFAGVSLFAALGFLIYGGRLFLMLQRFPVESKGRRKKLHEIGYVTAICFVCFLVRCIMMCFNAFNKAANLDILEHPVLNFIYYLLVEIVPSSLVMFILRKMPPKRGIVQHHAIG